MAVFNAGNRLHRQHFYGDSIDTKPTNTYIGDLFYELDTGKTLIFDGVSWQEYKQNVRIHEGDVEPLDTNFWYDSNDN
jgi:hypothetical protein